MWHEMKIEKEMVKLEPANWQLSKVRCWAIVKRSHDNSADLQPNLALWKFQNTFEYVDAPYIK